MYDIIIIIVLIFGGQTLGAAMGLITKPSNRLLHTSLAYAGSMMIAISFLELIPQGLAIAPLGTIVLSFLLGILVFVFVDHVIPHIHPEFLKKECNKVRKSVDMLLIGISLHTSRKVLR